jgi:predicted PurR-regulated permease PerM
MPLAQTSIRPPPHRSQVSLTTVFTVCLGVAAVAGLVYFLLRTTVALTLSVGSAMAAIALDLAAEALVRRGLRRSLAMAAVILVATALLVGLGFLLVPPIVEQVGALVAAAPGYYQKLLHASWFRHLDAQLHLQRQLQEQLREAGPAAVGAMNPLLSAIGGLLTGLTGLLAFFFLSIFMLVFGRELATASLEQLEAESRERPARLAAKIYRSVGGYLVGLLGLCALNALLTTIFLVLIQVPYFLPLGILCGASSLIPYAGPLVVSAVVTVFALLTGGTWTALAAAIYFTVYGQLEGNVLSPFIYRRTAHVNPLVTLLAILFLVEFMGIAGAVVAVPVAAAAQILLAEWLAAAREEGAPVRSMHPQQLGGRAAEQGGGAADRPAPPAEAT